MRRSTSLPGGGAMSSAATLAALLNDTRSAHAAAVATMPALLDEWRQRCAAFAEGSAAACAVAADGSRDGDDVELADWAVHGELAICQVSFWLSENARRTKNDDLPRD